MLRRIHWFLWPLALAIAGGLAAYYAMHHYALGQAAQNIRDDNDYWQRVAEYVSRHTDARFSHGICPACWELHYAEWGLPPAGKAGGEGSTG